MARAGMTSIIQKLRQTCEAGTADYSLAGETYWSDDDLQDVLDQGRERHVGIYLTARPDYVAGENIYTRYEMPRGIRGLAEGTAGGTAVFRVYDSNGNTVAGTAYTFSEREWAITFNADQDGTAYYWSGYTYDFQAAAAEVWTMKAAHAWTAINFSADGHRFDREALHAHCLQMAQLHGANLNGGAGAKQIGSTRMVRQDVIKSGGGGQL